MLPKQFAKDKNLSVLEAGNKILNSVMPVKSLFGNTFLPEKDIGGKARDEKIGNTQIRSYGIWFSNTDDIFNIIFSSYGIIDNNGSIMLDEYLEESDAPTTTNGVINKKNQIHKAIFQHAVIDLKALENNISKANAKLGEILKVLKATKIVSTTAKEQINCANEIMLRTYKSAEDLVKIITRAYDWLTNNRINQESEDTELTSNVDIPSEVDPELAVQDLQDATQEINASIDAAEESEALEADANDELEAIEDRLKSGDQIDPVEVAIVNESIQNYSKLLGLTRESVNLSLEDVRNNTRESMEGLKVELEGIGEKIKEYGKKAWDKIVELIKQFTSFLSQIRNSLSKRIQNILTNGLEIPDEEFELTNKERTVLTFGFKYLIDSHTKAIDVLSVGVGKAGEKLLKMDPKTNSDEARRIGEEAGNIIRDMASKLKPEDNNPNINMKSLIMNIKPQVSRNNEKLLVLLPTTADDEANTIEVITVTINSKSGNTGVVKSGRGHFGDIKNAKEYSAFVDKVYRDKEYLTKEVNVLKSTLDMNKSYLDNLFNLGTLIAKRQDQHMSTRTLEDINNQSPIYYGELEHCKGVIKAVLTLGKNYIGTVDCFVKYIEKHFVNRSDSKDIVSV